MKNKSPQITIYGFGYVGRAVWRLLKDHYAIQIIDPIFYLKDGARKPQIDLGHGDDALPIGVPVKLDAAEKTKYAIICVPTPPKDGGSADVSAVAEALTNSDHEFYMIKSTVPPKTTMTFSNLTKKKICFSPEYIGEGKYAVQWWKDRGYPHPTDLKYHDFTVFGGTWRATSEWVKVWQKVMGPGHKYIQTDSLTAELMKYMVNAWGAMKVVFCNEFYEIARALDADYANLRELFLLDGRVERMHTLVFPEARGFGGKCFPKDLDAIIKTAEENGYKPELLKEIVSSNERFKERNKNE